MIVVRVSKNEIDISSPVSGEATRLLSMKCVPCILYINEQCFVKVIQFGESEFLSFVTDKLKQCKVSLPITNRQVITMLKST
jgi:hypothetical protein